MHIYAFGSLCRGEVTPGSDVDLLAIVDGHDARFSPDDYSIYSYERIREIWNEGNPFAWHLSIEAKPLYASNQSDFLLNLGRPKAYARCRQDCEKFLMLFRDARTSIESLTPSRIFDLSIMFLAIRNFATCYSLGVLDKPDFSRSSALRLGDDSLAIPNDAYKILERARILCTRGVGELIKEREAEAAVEQSSRIEQWMTHLLGKVDRHAARV